MIAFCKTIDFINLSPPQALVEQFKFVDLIGVKLISDVCNVFMFLIYIPPISTDVTNQLYIEFISHFTEYLLGFEGKLLIICDFNAREFCLEEKQLVKSARSLCLYDLMNQLDLQQTNGVVNDRGVCLDPVFSNISCDVRESESKIVDIDLAHPVLEIEINIVKVRRLIVKETNCCIYDYKRVDYDELNLAFSFCDWSSMLTAVDVDDAVDIMYAIIYNIFDLVIPKASNVVKDKKYPQWFTREIINFIKVKNRIHTGWKKSGEEKLKNEHSRVREEIKAKIKSVRVEHFRIIGKKIQYNPAEFWNYVDEIMNGCKTRRILAEGNNMINDPVEVANKFADYSSSVYESFIVEGGVNNIYPSHLNSDSNSNLNLNLNEMSSINDAVIEAFKSLADKGTKGLDDIPCRLVRKISTWLIYPLTIIISEMLETSKYPDEFKITKVILVHKKNGSADQAEFHRPISIINSLAKVVEICLYDSLYQVYDTVKSDCQHGFIPGRSTTTNLTSLTNFIHEAIRRGNQVDVIYSDFSKAFDNHASIVEKELVQKRILTLKWPKQIKKS